MRLDGRLKFNTIPCVRCGSKRVMELACGECGKGAPSGEVNPPVVGRRQLVKRIRSLLSVTGFTDKEDNRRQPKEELPEVVHQFIASFADLLSAQPPNAAVEGVVEAIDRTDRMVSQLRRESGMRPAAEARAYLSVAVELSTLWSLYLDAMVTADISEAEALAARGQEILDSSTSELVRLKILWQAIGALVSNADVDLITRVFGALALVYPERDFSELAKMGERRAKALVGHPVGLGSSIDFLTVEMVSRAYLDPERFNLKIRELASLLHRGSRVHAIAKMPVSLVDLGIARRDLFESLMQFEKIASAESDQSVLLRRLSKTVGELYEASLPFLVWCRLILSPSVAESTYERLILKDATEHVAWLAKKLPLTYSDVPAFLRHAAHHGRAIDIDPGGESVAVRLRSFSHTFSAPEFIDKAYSLLESLLAVCWVIGNALEVEGLNAPLPPGAAQYMGLTQDVLAGFWLREFRGVRVIESRRAGAGWTLELGIAEEETFVTALALATAAGPDCDWVRVQVEGHSGPPVEVHLNDYSRYADEAVLGGAQTALGLLELRHQMTDGTRCLVTESDVEFVIVCLSLAILGGELSQVALLRDARQQAIRHGFNDLGSLANRVLATIRSGEDSIIRRELSERTTSFSAVQVPVVPALRVHLRGATQLPSRDCD